MISFALKISYNKTTILLFFYILIAIILSFYASRNYILEWDECNYATLGKNLVTGKGYTIGGKPHLHFPPLYPLLIGIFYKLIGNLEIAAKAVSFISFLVAIPIFFKLISLIYNKFIAHIATFLFSTHFFIIDYSYRALTHSVDVLLVILILFFGILILKNKNIFYRYFIAFSILCSFAILNRSENIISSIVLIIYIFLNTKDKIKKRLLALLFMIIFMFIILFPYAYFLHKYTGAWTVTTKVRLIKHYECVLTNNCVSTPVKVPFRFNLFLYIKNNFTLLIKRYFYMLPKFFIQLFGILYGGVGFLIIILSFFKRLKCNSQIDFFLIFSLTPLLIIPLGPCYFRFFLFSIPIFICWIAYGLFEFLTYIKHFFRLSYKIALLILVVLLLGLSFFSRFIYYRSLNIKNPFSPLHNLTALKEMGIWIRKNITDIDKKQFADISPVVAFYAGINPYLINSLTNKKELFLYLKKNKINFLCVNSNYIRRKCPWFSFLLDKELENKNLVKMYEIKDKITVILYKVDIKNL